MGSSKSVEKFVVFKGNADMKNPITKILRRIWTFKQPITKIPKGSKEVISDLFLWRNSDHWQTFFELIDLSGLFDTNSVMEENFVELVFFEADGSLILKKQIPVLKNKRETLDLSCFLLQAEGEYGTFSVFHSTTPLAVSQLGSFITERGYTSYKSKNSILRSYVHGNLDAVSFDGESISLLGARSFFNRKYNLQYLLDRPALYEFGLVNSTQYQRKVTYEVYSQEGGKLVEKEIVIINPGGINVYALKMNEINAARVVISSSLVMARPLVFRTNQNNMDVFHG